MYYWKEAGLNFVKHLWMIPYSWNICTSESIGLKDINVLNVQEDKHGYGMKIGHKYTTMRYDVHIIK